MELMIELLLVSLIIGVGIMYILLPRPNIILKYPTDDKTMYIDNNNVCYKYEKKYL